MLDADHTITASADPQGQIAGDEAHAGFAATSSSSREHTIIGAVSANKIAEPDALQALSGLGDVARVDCVDGPRGQILPSEPNSPPAASNGAQRGSFPLIKRGPFKGLIRDGYDLIMADPAWSFETYSEKGQGKSPQAHYRCMSLEAIKRLPVAQLALQDCLLWLWATNPMLDQAFEVMAAWGFTFKTAGSWEKKTKHGKQAFGLGYYLRSSNEPYLIGAIGKPKTANDITSSFDGLKREHSRKPEEGFERAERLMPHARRIELFSRQSRPGWSNWGAEAEKFNA